MYELINRIIVRGMQTAYKRVEKDGSIRVLDHLRGRCVAVHVHLSRIVIVQRSRLITAFDNCSFYRDARPIERTMPTNVFLSRLIPRTFYPDPFLFPASLALVCPHR